MECNPACLDNNISKKLQNVTEFVNLQRLITTREREATTTKLGYNTIYNNNTCKYKVEKKQLMN